MMKLDIDDNTVHVALALYPHLTSASSCIYPPKGSKSLRQVSQSFIRRSHVHETCLVMVQMCYSRVMSQTKVQLSQRLTQEAIGRTMMVLANEGFSVPLFVVALVPRHVGPRQYLQRLDVMTDGPPDPHPSASSFPLILDPNLSVHNRHLNVPQHQSPRHSAHEQQPHPA